MGTGLIDDASGVFDWLAPVNAAAVLLTD